MDKITTTIKEPFLSLMVAGKKKIEYRELKKYWTKKLSNVCVPFELRLINGMRKRAPEATFLIKKIKKDSREGVYELHIGKVLKVKNLTKAQIRRNIEEKI